MNYFEFITSKKKIACAKGIEIAEEDLNPVLFDFQRFCVCRALSQKVFCLFEQCGLGKTLQQLEWAYQVYKHTGRNVIIFAPLCVTTQTAYEEAPLLGYDVNICRSQSEVKTGLNITNYEMLDNFTDDFGGVVLDESSILKNFTGSTRTRITNKCKNIPFKLCCTATPAPNDLMELLNHADFLGVMSTAQALANYFINDMKTGEWRLKGHATKDFYRWCCTWSINIDSPSDIGFMADKYILPKLSEYQEIIEIDELDETFENGFFRNLETSATGFHKEKKRTAELRAKKCAELVDNSTEQFIIWCDTNTEADYLKSFIPEAVEVRGSDSQKKKEAATQDFKDGKVRILISKPTIFGYGMNFQKCHNMIFCGLTYSYENYYQALRRVYRFGQKSEVNSWIVLGSTELHILDVINQKRRQQEELKNNMDQSIKDIQLKVLNEEKEETVYYNQIVLPSWI